MVLAPLVSGQSKVASGLSGDFIPIPFKRLREIQSPNVPGGASCPQDFVLDQVKPDEARPRGFVLEVTADSVEDLFF